MDVIRYRAWNKHTGEWVQFNGVKDMSCWQVFNGKVELLQGNDWVWQQYTGLNDRHGVAIYDGDIVKYKAGAGPWVTAVVRYDNAAWFKGHQALNSYVKTTEVIGNIYDNPEGV